MPDIKNSNLIVAAAVAGAVVLTSRFAWKRMKKRKAS